MSDDDQTELENAHNKSGDAKSESREKVGKEPLSKTSSADQCCSFCGKGVGEVAKLIEGPSACICNECLAKANDVIKGEEKNGK